MKITHTISSLDISTGGPARSSTSLINELLLNSNISAIDVLTLLSNEPIVKQCVNDKGKINFFNSSFLDYSNDLKIYLNNNKKSDVLHTHGIWGLTMHQAAKEARRQKKPYVVSVRGMLEPWSMQQSRLKKKLAMFLYQHKDLKNAACIHATALSEAESIRNLGYKNPIAVIPNGIDLSEYPLKDKKDEISDRKKTLLFLSRIHPKKGIEILLETWKNISSTNKEDWQIEIAGNGEESYIKELNDKIINLGLQNSVKIIGPQFGDEKIRAYHRADLFVLPTYSENFGMVVAEALACGVPVITTKGTPWEDLELYQSGSWIDIGVESLKNCLEEYLIKSTSELQQMGVNGRKLVEDKYSIQSVAEQFIELYQWLINSSSKKPNFVILD
ncbi:glycosyltransferase [Chishuiella sp.]|uniref:glycosyltransferase n=1 Tax=Chishuiella sp. TaxID=1969467 RepID=UPI0028A9E647|nr:glycosyltransferase [Chishuiella sp.]